MKTFKVFILEDEYLITRSLQIILESMGHQVQSTSSGEEALNLWGKFKPDLAFIDILLPGMNGLDFLKKRPQHFLTKIVLISAHDNLNEKELLSLGACLFVKKPFKNIFQLVKSSLQLLS
ncbi:MAG: response regulator [Bdellovibrionales bacterium]|nr:response regulator [Bdellovibrionales bacterium]